jgi:leader peptidase (prepilin peptidase)/N-methyltransferase
MQALIELAAVGYGACVGSFLNVCIFRLPRRCLRLWKPKLSFCPKCRRTIPWHDNLPILGYLLLLGRCRGCHAEIPLRYFMVELATTLFFLYVAAQELLVAEPRWALAAVQVVFFAALLVCALVDWDHMVIPDEIDIPGFLLAPLVCALVPALLPRPVSWASSPRLDAALTSVEGAAIGAAVVWTIGWVGGKIARRPEGAMGFGDVKLIAMIGGLTGWQGALAALLGGSVVGSFYGVARRLRGGDNVVPFGPFLALGGGAFAFVPEFRGFVLEALDMLARAAELLWRH